MRKPTPFAPLDYADFWAYRGRIYQYWIMLSLALGLVKFDHKKVCFFLLSRLHMLSAKALAFGFFKKISAALSRHQKITGAGAYQVSFGAADS